ncbi:hypothetical protein DPMN_020229, partial [Dreissena polymorpha]
MKSLSDRKQFLREKTICFRLSIKCCVSGNPNQTGALHVEPAHFGVPATQGGEREQAAYRDRQPNQRAD